MIRMGEEGMRITNSKLQSLARRAIAWGVASAVMLFGVAETMAGTINLSTNDLKNPVVIVDKEGDGQNEVSGSFTLKPGKVYKFEVWGGRGGEGENCSEPTWSLAGGNGGYSMGWYSTNASVTAYYHVGGAAPFTFWGPGLGGYNGGGNGGFGVDGGGGGGGGGASDIRIGGTTLDDRVIVAGGGGGLGGIVCTYIDDDDGMDCFIFGHGGYGGSGGYGEYGGEGHTGYWTEYGSGSDMYGGGRGGNPHYDASGIGGDGEYAWNINCGGGGGGGGGYYGGEGGGRGNNNDSYRCFGGGGGGGGSCYVEGVNSLMDSFTMVDTMWHERLGWYGEGKIIVTEYDIASGYDDPKEAWVFIDSIKVTSSGDVELAWKTNRVEVANAKYVVYATTSITNSVAKWVQLCETNAVITVTRSPSDPMHRTTLENCTPFFPALFFKVKAVQGP